MIDLLITIGAFLLAIGILVAVHEWGHYIVARRLGVGVIRYSIGFGNRVAGFTSKSTGIEYRLSAIPLGGYVKLLDEGEGPVAEEQKHRAMNRAHPLRRIAIVAAGPGINFLFAIAAYWLVLVMGVSGIQPIVAAPPAGSIADRIGIEAQSEIVAINGQPVESWRDLKLMIVDHALSNDRVVLTLQKDSQIRESATLDLAGLPETPKELFNEVGLSPYRPPATPVVAKILDESPAARSGLQSGDRIKALDGQAVDSPAALVEAIHARPGERVKIKLIRDGEAMTTFVDLASKPGSSGEPGPVGRLGIAIGVDTSAWQKMRTTRQLGFVEAVPVAAEKTWNLSALTVRMLAKMVTGDVSWRNIGGPVQIAKYAGQTASIGFVAFVSFLALISLSLAVINLLPIPVLDGGHIVYYLAEWILGRPIGDATRAVWQSFGIAALVALMGLAFYNDILRLTG